MKSDDGSGGKSLLYRIWNSTKAKAGAKEASSRETIEEIFGLNKETTRTPDADTTQKSEGENIEQDVEQSPGSDTKQSPGADVEQSPGADVEQSSETVMEQGPGLEPTVEDAPDSEPEPKDQHPHGDIMKIKHNYLEAIRSGIELTDMQDNTDAFFSDFILDATEPDGLKKIFIRELQQTAKSILDMSQPQEPQEEPLEEGQPKREPELMPINAQVCVKVPSEQMAAWLFIFPAKNGGKEITEDLIREALNESRVRYGVDNTLIKQMAIQRVYLKLAVVAVGKLPVDGIDGTIIDHFPRVERNKFEEQTDLDDKSVDFKKLNWLHQIAEDDIVCDITMPVNGVDGSLVTGQVIKARQPEKFNLPDGENVVMNAEKTALRSKINGTLFFERGKFQVKDVLNIMSNVDLTVGNIDTVGNLVINGDVLSGFTVKATGNINIRGMVGNAKIIAGGSIKVGMGVRGYGEAFLQAGDTVSCVYMESCTVHAKGAVDSGSIINCDVISDDVVTSKTIVGGSTTALNRIAAHTIGNHQRRPAIFNLGITQQTLQEKTELLEQSKELEAVLSQSEKSVRFLKSKKRLDAHEGERCNILIVELLENQRLLKECSRRLEEIDKVIAGFSQCELTANLIYPPVTVMIRSDSLVIDRESSMCKIWSDNGEIKMS